MSSDDSRIGAYYAIRPQFRDILRLEIHQLLPPKVPVAEASISLELLGISDSSVLHLRFHRVSSLRLTPPERSVIQMSLLEIRSIRDRGMEDQKYHVIE